MFARHAPIALDESSRLCKLERLQLLDAFWRDDLARFVSLRELVLLALTMMFAALIAEQSEYTAQLLDFNQRI